MKYFYLWIMGFLLCLGCTTSVTKPTNNIIDNQKQVINGEDTTNQEQPANKEQIGNAQDVVDASEASSWVSENETVWLVNEVSSDANNSQSDTETAMIKKDMSSQSDTETAMMKKDMSSQSDTETAMMKKDMNSQSGTETVMIKKDMNSQSDTETVMMKKDMSSQSGTETVMIKKDMNSQSGTETVMMKKESIEEILSKDYNPDPRTVIKSVDDISKEKQNFVDNLKDKYLSKSSREFYADSSLVGKQLAVTRFIGNNGDLFDVTDYKGKKIVLIILRGFAGGVCLACSAQTLALSNTVEQFKENNAQIILVYPGRAESIPVFTEVLANLTENFELPFPVVLDVELQLVQSLSIDGSLARPTSIITNSDAEILYAYVGKSITDRPTVDFLLQEVKKLSEPAIKFD